MKLHPGVRLVLAALTFLLLLALTFEGITGGVKQLPQSQTPGQIAQSIAQLLYGIGALMMIATAIRWRGFATPIQLGFIASCVAASSLATITWGAGSLLSGLVAGVGALVVATLLVFLLRIAVIPLFEKAVVSDLP
jgi:hypothetical protein